MIELETFFYLIDFFMCQVCVRSLMLDGIVDIMHNISEIIC